MIIYSKAQTAVVNIQIEDRKSARKTCEDKSKYFKNTLYLYRCLRAKQLLRASELMRAAYHEKEVQFNPIKDNQRPTATRDEYLLLFWWLNGSTEGLRLRLFSIKKTRNWSLTRNRIVEENIALLGHLRLLTPEVHSTLHFGLILCECNRNSYEMATTCQN